MRLTDIESKLSPVIKAYLKDAYPHLQDKSYPVVICLDDVQFKATLRVRDRKTMLRGAYNIPNNTMYFRNRPTETAVAHEVEHWAQAQMVGPKVIIEQMQSEKTFREYEKSADDAASTNVHKLTGKY